MTRRQVYEEALKRLGVLAAYKRKRDGTCLFGTTLVPDGAYFFTLGQGRTWEEAFADFDHRATADTLNAHLYKRPL